MKGYSDQLLPPYFLSVALTNEHFVSMGEMATFVKPDEGQPS